MFSAPDFKDFYENLDEMLKDLDYLSLMEVRQTIFNLENLISDFNSLPDLLHKKLSSYALVLAIIVAIISFILSVHFFNIDIFISVFISISSLFIVKKAGIKALKAGVKEFQDDSKRLIVKTKFVLEQYKEREWELTQDRKSDRELARELKRKRAMGQIDDERLIYQYSQLQAIQNQSNQQAVEFFQQAQQALRYDRKSDLDYSLDQLERALGV